MWFPLSQRFSWGQEHSGCLTENNGNSCSAHGAISSAMGRGDGTPLNLRRLSRNTSKRAYGSRTREPPRYKSWEDVSTLLTTALRITACPSGWLIRYSEISPALRSTNHKQMATPRGLEPLTSSVTGWRANRLHHRAIFWWKVQGSNL